MTRLILALINTAGLVAGVVLVVMDPFESNETPSPASSASVSLTPPPPVELGPELAPNPNLEQAGRNRPASWTSDTWGSSRARFSYVRGDAHSGSASVKIEVTDWEEGDSKWTHEPVPVRGGRYYAYSGWYKSTGNTAVAMAFVKSDGSTEWVNLNQGVAPSPDRWTEFKSGVTAPPTAVEAYSAHFIKGEGVLQLDSVSMREALSPVGFSRGIVSLTFDDASMLIFNNLYRVEEKGWTTTQYAPTGKLGDPGLWSEDEFLRVLDAGHEIGAHSINHPELTSLPPDELSRESREGRDTLVSIVGEGAVSSFATPFGAYNSAVVAQLKADGYSNHRSTDVGYNSRLDLDPWNIKVQNIRWTTTPEEVKGWVDEAAKGRYWLVLVYHGITPTPTDPVAGEYQTTPEKFQQNLEDIKASGLSVQTVGSALNEIMPQVAG
jgi:peptidoglycan/xylan/chitin deacetylase (PgdA/CDA1 family)